MAAWFSALALLTENANPSEEEIVHFMAGNLRVRNAATIGGHLHHADPAQDMPPLLIALDAEVHLISKEGKRVVTMEDFLVDTMETSMEPHELIEKVTIPADFVRADEPCVDEKSISIITSCK